MSPDPSTYLSVAGLKARGWSMGLIAQLLGPPDATAHLPYYSNVSPIKLYLTARVEACEQRADWEALRAPSLRRQASAALAVDTKHQQVQNYLEHLLVVVPRWPEAELIERACCHYNMRQVVRAEWYAAKHRSDWDGMCWGPASATSSALFLGRIEVNYLRHECSCYDQELAHLTGKVRADWARQELHAKVCAAIAAAYPGLAEECARQVAAKGGEEGTA